MTSPALKLEPADTRQVVGEAIGFDPPQRAGSVQVGERFGDLVTLRIHGSGRHGHVWLCECDCGRLALRSASQLHQSIAKGCRPTCAQCHRELLRGLRIVHDQMQVVRRNAIARHFAMTGSLYGNGWEEVELKKLRRALELPDPAPDPVSDTEELYSSPGLADRYAMTLDELAEEFDVSRERIRQIEAKALRKLRHPSRAKYLVDFLGDKGDQWSEAARQRGLLAVQKASIQAAARYRVQAARKAARSILQLAGNWNDAVDEPPPNETDEEWRHRHTLRVQNERRMREIIERSRATEHALAVDAAIRRIAQIESRLERLAQRSSPAPESEVDQVRIEQRTVVRDARRTVEGWPEDGLGEIKDP